MPDLNEAVEKAWRDHLENDWGVNTFAAVHTQASGSAYKSAFKYGFDYGLEAKEPKK